MTGDVRQGMHVHYMERQVLRDALVQIVFRDNGDLPFVTLCYVRTGAHGEMVTKAFIPHESRWDEAHCGFWRWPS